MHAGAVPFRARDQIDHGGLGAVRGQVPDAVVVSLEAALARAVCAHGYCSPEAMATIPDSRLCDRMI
ncbi:hypothetical protein ADL30_20795 [Streptomyces sp. NRRL S-1521]|nr:hypothetical protein ADL30_20795 [Streptomyces sp. NRRL S-1521]